MAYALNYPNAPAADANVAEVAAPAVVERSSFFARLMNAIQRSQMARVERELAIYAPSLYAQMKADGDFSRVSLSQSEKLPFVK